MADFGERLRGAFAARGQLCLGIDPHRFLLERWGLADSADGVREFGLAAVRAAAATVGIVKPQVAFFERYGAAGYAALETVIGAARDVGLLVIADAKRGDIGTSVEAYGEAWLSPGSPLESDAVTVSAFQGVGSLAATLHLAETAGKGVFVLAATSNVEAAAIQTALVGRGGTAGRSVADGIVIEVARHNESTGDLGSIGVVLGATLDLADYGIDPVVLARTPVLAPGVGAQGATFDDLPRVFGPASRNLIVSVSRSVLDAGPGGLSEALRRSADELEGALQL